MSRQGDLLNLLYSARFFRRRPELTPALMEILTAVLEGRAEAVPVFMLWGVHEKRAADSLDDRTMAQLSALIERLHATLLCPAPMTIALCDTHASVNGVDAVHASAYADDVTRRAHARGWQVVRVSTIWERYGISMAQVDNLVPSLGSDPLLPRLTSFAQRHYRGTADVQAGATRYLAARILERPVFEQQFAGALHLTPSEPAIDAIQPDLPTFHIWTWRKGCSAKPWFNQEGP